jgi:hypothetical protein
MKSLFFLLFVAFSQSLFAQEDHLGKAFSFPIKIGDEQWRKLGNTHERIVALQIPRAQKVPEPSAPSSVLR